MPGSARNGPRLRYCNMFVLRIPVYFPCFVPWRGTLTDCGDGEPPGSSSRSCGHSYDCPSTRLSPYKNPGPVIPSRTFFITYNTFPCKPPFVDDTAASPAVSFPPARPRSRSCALVAALCLVALAGVVPAAGAGGTSWFATYSTCPSCIPRALAATSEGGYAATGSSPAGLFVLKTDAGGTEQWLVHAGSGTCTGAAAAAPAPGGIAVLGNGCDTGGGLLLDLMDARTGTVQRSIAYGSGEAGTSLAGTEDTGSILLSQGAGGAGLRRVSSAGTVIWERNISGDLAAPVRGVAVSGGGGMAVAGTAGSGALALGLYEASGTVVRVVTFSASGKGTPAAVAALPDGGYLVAGTACTDSRSCSFFAARTGTDGTVLWERQYGGGTVTALIPAADGGYTLAGTARSGRTTGANREIRIEHISDDGTGLWNATYGNDRDLDLAGAAAGPGDTLVLAGSEGVSSADSDRIPFLASFADAGRTPPAEFSRSQAAPPEGTGLTVIVTDARTGSPLAGAAVYRDGEYLGTTGSDGSLAPGGAGGNDTHSYRATAEGYREETVAGTGTGEVDLALSPSAVHRILGSASPDTALDIVFVPSNTSYSCTDRQKEADNRYAASAEAFLADIRPLVTEQLLGLSSFTSRPDEIPAGLSQHLNVWYYWDGERFADAFDGCAGRLPEGYADEVPFADMTVILYPSYTGAYTGPECEPQGCANGPGAGSQSCIKTPAGKGRVFLHETGHALFGLMDTYCGETYYAENDPHANIWGSAANCSGEAAADGWNISLCRPLAATAATGACTGSFWRADPDPDLMGDTGPGAIFGNASTARIRYVLDEAGWG